MGEAAQRVERAGRGIAIESDEDLVGAGAGGLGGEGFGDVQHAELVGQGDRLLSAAGRPQVLGGRDHARYRDGLPPGGGVDGYGGAGVQLEVVGHVVFDQYPVGRVGRVAPGQQGQGVDRGLGAGRDADDPAAQLVGTDL